MVFKIADLYCKAGGAGMGLHRAGFEVVGFDIEPQPHYPFEFHQRDVTTMTPEEIREFDAIGASPPCQDGSIASNVQRNTNGKNYPNLLQPTRELLQGIDVPYVIENVPRSDFPATTILCGLMFNLPIFRHRYFESSILIPSLPHITHKGKKIGEGCYSIAGGSGRWKSWGTVHRNVSKGTKAEWSAAMGIDWMTRAELIQAVPPAYAEYLGKELMKWLHHRCDRKAVRRLLAG